MRTEFLHDLDADRYHADPCESPSLSASVAGMLIRQSPLHAWAKHPKLGAGPDNATPEMERGTILHALVLNQEPPWEIVDAPNYRTKAAQEQRDLARAIGGIPVLTCEADALQRLADATARAIESLGVRLCGTSELTMLWPEQTRHGQVQCRGRTDHAVIGSGSATLYDLKFLRTADPREFGATAYRSGYDVQAAAYLSAVEAVRPDLAGRVEFVWLLVEETRHPVRPVVVTACHPSGVTLELGRRRWARACETWAACLAADHWPGYSPNSASIDPPAWAVAEEGFA